MTEEIIITNEKKLAETIMLMQTAGADGLHVLADFDRTFTNAFASDGSEAPSLIFTLRNDGYLTPDYPQKAEDLFVHYHSIEIDLKISKEEKKTAMKEWWTKHFELLIASHLNIKDVKQAMLSQRV